MSAWLEWLGAGRLIASAVSVVVVAVGAFWLVRSPVPAAESGLPVAVGTAGSSVTLPPPPQVAAPVASQPVSSRVVVHVAGEVVRPGVYELQTPARVHQAIDLAGGATPTGDLDGLNLAASLTDGERVYVPTVGEVDPAGVPSGAPVEATSTPQGPIDLNSGSAADFDTLPGVGPATAAAIVDDRERNGPFASVDDLDRVPGIGPSKLEALRELVTV
jgi:competence protein ComEA